MSAAEERAEFAEERSTLMDTQIRDLEEENTQLGAERDQLASTSEELVSSRHEVMNVVAKLAEVTDERDCLKTTLSKLTEKSHNRESEITSLEDRLAVAAADQDALARLENDIKVVRDSEADLRRHLTEAQTLLLQFDADANKRMNARIVELEAELQDRADQLREAMENEESVRRQADQASQRCDSLEREVVSLRGQLNKMAANNTANALSAADQQALAQASEAKSISLRAEKDEISMALVQVQRERESMTGALEDAIRERDLAVQARTRTAENLVEAEAVCDRLQNEARGLNTQIREKERAIEEERKMAQRAQNSAKETVDAAQTKVSTL